MNETFTPTSVSELSEVVRASPRLLAIGGRSKSRLCSAECVNVSTAKLSGILEYEPAEFTITALAGTRVRDIADTLKQSGQHLPFDPMLARSGATLGGTVASGLSGPGRFRFGGVRDFILGVRFVDGTGRLLRSGGKVVKNAAGYDLPKFFVGSLGRFGVLAEITFKVFPRPASSLTLRFDVKGPEVAAKIFIEAANTRWELDAIDLLPGGTVLCMRIAGPRAGLELLADEILQRWQGDIVEETKAESLWNELSEFQWTFPDGVLLKAPLMPRAVAAFCETVTSLGNARIHVSAGGNVAYASFDSGVEVSVIEKVLRQLRLGALTLRGVGPLWWNVPVETQIARSIKTALDSCNRFPSLFN